MFKHRLFLLSLMPLLFLALLLPMSTAHAASHIPFATCHASACEGQAPPPVGPTNCVNAGLFGVAVQAVYDHNSVHIGDLNLFYSNNTVGGATCITTWVGFKNIASSSTCYTITGLSTFETGDDNSGTGALDSIPHTICGGSWESTKMVEWLPSNGWCYHGFSKITDENGFTGIITNTATHCP